MALKIDPKFVLRLDAVESQVKKIRGGAGITVTNVPGGGVSIGLAPAPSRRSPASAAVAIPAPQYQFQTLQGVAANQAGWDYVRSYPVV